MVVGWCGRLVPPEGGGEEGGRQGATVVFVTAPNCKVCMYTKPKVSQAGRQAVNTESRMQGRGEALQYSPIATVSAWL